MMVSIGSDNMILFSISLVLDDGDCFVGDLEPFEYHEAYTENAKLKRDWEQILSFCPRRIFYAHMPETGICGGVELKC